MSETWCAVCCTRHGPSGDCPGELPATGPERHGWRVNVETPQGLEAYGVLVAESREFWRARIMTFPKILWLVPGGSGTIKFIGGTAQDAEGEAIAFIRRHCSQKGYRMHERAPRPVAGRIDLEGQPLPPRLRPAIRVIRFLPVRFGVTRPSEAGGTGNISVTGMFVITKMPVLTGTDLQLMLGVKDRTLPLEGCVRWASEQHRVGRSPGMGIQLKSPPQAYQRYVRSLYE